MTRDELRKIYYGNKLIVRIKDGVLFQVVKSSMLESFGLHLVVYCKVKLNKTLGRERVKDMISFCKTHQVAK